MLHQANLHQNASCLSLILKFLCISPQTVEFDDSNIMASVLLGRLSDHSEEQTSNDKDGTGLMSDSLTQWVSGAD